MFYDSFFKGFCKKSTIPENRKIINVFPSEYKFLMNVNIHLLPHNKNSKIATQSS